MQILSLFLALSTAAAESTPGTETILLVRGGYGPGVNLFSSGSQTHRHLKSHSKAPVDRTSAEKNELAKLSNVSKTASMLNSQLQTAIKSTYSALQEAEQVRVDDANLKERVTMDERKIKQGAEAEKAKAQLEAEVKSLQAQLAAEKSKTAAEHARGVAFQQKAASLEQDIKLISKSWKAAAQHQADLAKQAMGELKTKKVAAVAKAAVAKEAVKKVAKQAVKKVAIKVAAEDDDSDADSDSDDAEADDSEDDEDDSSEDN